MRLASFLKARPAEPEAPADHKRLRVILDFVTRFAPAHGERHDGLHRADDHSERSVLIARDDALVAAFEAIERLARSC